MVTQTHRLLAAVVLQNEYQLSTGKKVADYFGKPSDLVNLLLANAYIAAGLVILFLLVFGGLSIIMAGGDQKGVDKGKQAITSAVIGFVIIFTAYWVIQIIELVTHVRILGA